MRRLQGAIPATPCQPTLSITPEDSGVLPRKSTYVTTQKMVCAVVRRETAPIRDALPGVAKPQCVTSGSKERPCVVETRSLRRETAAVASLSQGVRRRGNSRRARRFWFLPSVAASSSGRIAAANA